jgi:hypothetical protein
MDLGNTTSMEPLPVSFETKDRIGEVSSSRSIHHRE